MAAMSLSVEEIAAGAGVLALGAVGWLSVARAGVARRRAEFREHRRARRAQAAAVEASMDEDAFAPEVVAQVVDEIVTFASAVWRVPETRADRRADASVILSWAQSVTASLGPQLRVLGSPSVDFLRVVNRPGEAEDRIVLRVRLRVRRGGQLRFGEPRKVTIDERWTLGRTAGSWVLLSIDADPLGRQALERPLVAVAWEDQDRLREQSLAELGSADASAAPVDFQGVVSPDRPVSEQLRELSQLDGRFDRDLLDLTITHLVEAWEEAGTGSAEPLLAVASTGTCRLLLHPPARDPRRRLILQDAAVERWVATKLSLASYPPRLGLEVTVSAVRYIVASDTGAHVSGSVEIRHRMQLDWTLTLADGSATPWQLTDTSNPAEGLPGIYR